ncbi:MAG: DUF3566 domain-containing protein [Acidimicrobiia bacterium]|nr:DUF3566 domain-containing protein [Acidimicrobiia bacterium]MBP8179386.1 DUF3566 domain-containing protein [Acidimicrobiia bacterium]
MTSDPATSHRTRERARVTNDSHAQDDEHRSGDARPSRPRGGSARNGEGSGQLMRIQTSRVILKVDPWSTLRVSLMFFLGMYTVGLALGVVLWFVGRAVGLFSTIESTVEGFGLDKFRLLGSAALIYAIIVGLLLVILSTIAAVVSAFVYNVASRTFGGLRVTHIEEVRPVRRLVSAPGNVSSPDRGRPAQRR